MVNSRLVCFVGMLIVAMIAVQAFLGKGNGSFSAPPSRDTNGEYSGMSSRRP